MAIEHDEIVAFLQEEIATLSLIALARPRKPRIEPEYEDSDAFGNNPESIEQLLDRWGDRKVPQED